jgi:uncharacterized protein YdbL (DUF1318 family)
MNQERLQSASENLRVASEIADGTLQRTLYEQSNNVAELAARSHQATQGQITEQLDDLRAVIQTVEEADDIPADVNSYLQQAKSDLAAIHDGSGSGDL